MDVLFASEVLVPSVGGAERAMLDWAGGLRERGHAVECVYLEPDERPGEDRYWRWRAEQRAEMGRRVAEALARRRRDVVVAQHHCAPAALAEAARAGAAGVLVLPSFEGLCKLAFDPGSDCSPDGDCVACPAALRLVPAERDALARGRREHDAALAAADGVAVHSRFLARTLQALRGRSSTVVWPAGATLPEPAGADPSGPVVCAAARWAAHKGIDLLPALVAAARALDPQRSVLVTETGVEPARRDALVGAGATLVARRPIEELLAGASLLLVPSQWEEPFGCIAWEAAALGVPVLASAAGGMVEAVPREVQVTPRDDLGAWRSAIERTLWDEPAWRRAATAGREHAATLLSPPPLDRLEALLRDGVARRHGRSGIPA